MVQSNSGNSRLIGFVGVCASGKTTIVRQLEALGYRCRHIAQEHSYVATMWLQLTHPDYLIYLAIDYPTTMQRKRLDWTQAEYDEQIRRLKHAYEHADLIVDTTHQSLQETLDLILHQLADWGVKPGDSPPRIP